jgi:pimeloyl-ACP methyl ester carboxylesterase
MRIALAVQMKHTVIAVFIMIALELSCPAQSTSLQPGREHIPGADVFITTVRIPAGYPLRAFITRPKDVSGKLPVIFEVAWLSCDSVEQPKGPEDGFTQLIWELASRSGFATYRVDKPGVGESGGPKCSGLDFTTELEAYRAAFKAMRDVDFLDLSRIYVIGFSNGGGVAPFVAGDAPVRGYLVFSGWYKTWLEHMLELERRRMRLTGVPEPEISTRMKQFATFYDLYLNGKKTPGQIISDHPEFKSIWYDEPEHQYGRPAAFYHQLQDLNLAEAWQKVNAPVLAVHGEFDWIMSEDEFKLLANAVNARHPRSAIYVNWPKMDHLLYIHSDEKKAFGRDPDKKYDPQLTQFVLDWLKKH